MPLSRTRDYMSIGEVLDAVRPDFPEVTISKIRFLEAEGLLTPERTESGYRKFFEPDVARLRYILHLQRDQFLPLKVIRERLASADSNGGVPEVGAARSESREPAPATPVAELAAVQLSRAELIGAAGLSEEQMKGLEEFGVIPARSEDVYDEADLLIAKAARRFFNFGVEPRHLKMYRQFADRESAFFEQILTPRSRRRDADGLDEAQRSLSELVSLSRQLRDATLRHSVSELL